MYTVIVCIKETDAYTEAIQIINPDIKEILTRLEAGYSTETIVTYKTILKHFYKVV